MPCIAVRGGLAADADADADGTNCGDIKIVVTVEPLPHRDFSKGPHNRWSAGRPRPGLGERFHRKILARNHQRIDDQ